MAHRHKVHRKNVGGALDAGGNPNVMEAAKSKSQGFKSGGAIPGKKGKMRFDKRARGGAAGRSPFSSAKTSEKGNRTADSGSQTRPR